MLTKLVDAIHDLDTIADKISKIHADGVVDGFGSRWLAQLEQALFSSLEVWQNRAYKGLCTMLCRQATPNANKKECCSHNRHIPTQAQQNPPQARG